MLSEEVVDIPLKTSLPYTIMCFLLVSGIILNILGLVMATFSFSNGCIVRLIPSLHRRRKAISKLETEGELPQTEPGFAEIYNDIRKLNPRCPEPSKFIFKPDYSLGQPRADRPRERGAIFNEADSQLIMLDTWCDSFTLAVNEKRRSLSFILLAIALLLVSIHSLSTNCLDKLKLTSGF